MCLMFLMVALILLDVFKGNIGMGLFFLTGGFFFCMTSLEEKSEKKTFNCVVAAILSFFSIIIGIFILLLEVGMI